MVATAPLNPDKFRDPHTTLKGEQRAIVGYKGLQTLWFNTGTLCNLTCENCYIESSPSNDALSFLTARDVSQYLDEVAALGERPVEIGFTGGEPFVNPHIGELLSDALGRGYRVLVLTNAMRPMLRTQMKQQLLSLKETFGAALVMRVSLDHYTSNLHEKERGLGSWAPTIKGVEWLFSSGFNVSIAGRTCWGESLEDARAGYCELFKRKNWAIDAYRGDDLVLFPEMQLETDLPEITVDCWDILGKSPSSMMCATSRMVVKRKGQANASVVACTLLPYTDEFDYGESLADARRDTYLNHPHCARFCVLGGASCSG